MPMQRSLYPDDWEAIAFQLKAEQNWTCEAPLCQRPCRRPEETRMDFVLRLYQTYGTNSLWWNQLYVEQDGNLIIKLQRFTLTVAHLNHIPSDCDRTNLRAWCAPCHCRYDLMQMATKKQLKLERQGQCNIFDLVSPQPAGHGRDPTRIQLSLRREVR